MSVKNLRQEYQLKNDFPQQKLIIFIFHFSHIVGESQPLNNFLKERYSQ